MTTKKTIVVGLLFFLSSLNCSHPQNIFISAWPEKTHRVWIGAEYWANRLQDWQLNDGRLECIDGTRPLRTVHLLTRSLGPDRGDLNMSVRTGVVPGSTKLSQDDWAGFLIGAGTLDLDYRARALIHQCTGENGGLVAAINGDGRAVFFDNQDSLKTLPATVYSGEAIKWSQVSDVVLRLMMRPANDAYDIILSTYNYSTGKLLNQATIEHINAERLTGNVALVANGGSDDQGRSYWFRDWTVAGSKVSVHDEYRFGAILGAMYTLSRGVLKMTAQLPPVAETDPQVVRLEIKDVNTNKWERIAEENLVIPGWTATFRVPEWDDTKTVEYRLVYPSTHGGDGLDYYYTGIIKADPRNKDEVVVAAFTGNSNTFGTFGKYFDFSKNTIWFPHSDIVQHVESQAPDLLVYTGDQVYEGRPTSPDRSGNLSSYLDYLYKWYLFLWAHGELTRNNPTVCMPDDHDVYHGNIWGAGGIKIIPPPRNEPCPAQYKGFEGHYYSGQDQGGYRMPAEFVKMVERTQTSHLPDPYDPTPVAQGIGVYYTAMNYGGISFAILEDRKFKSAPTVLLPEAKVVNGFPQTPNYDIRKADVPEAELLGERQLRFIRDWAADWRGAWMKVSLSQTLLACVSTYPKKFKTDAGVGRIEPVPFGVIPSGLEPAQDMDSNGWPQSKRNKALRELRRGFAFMIAGDQHLGSVVHHGVDEWDDAGFSFCVPSIANLWPRRWYPQEPGLDHQPGRPPYTGKYFDGFGNRITVWAVSNPVLSNHQPANLYDRAPGHGIIRFNKKAQTITMECWPRYSDPAMPDAKQYPGWPITIDVEDNYGRQAVAYLPILKFKGIENPVVQIVNEVDDEVVYTTRAKTNSFRAKIFEPGSYTVNVGEPGTEQMKTFANVHSVGESEKAELLVQF